MKKTNKGFSLVELIIVIAIMAILAGAIAPALIRYIDKSRKSNDVTAAKSIKTAVETAIGNEMLYELCTAGTAIGDYTAILVVEPGVKTDKSGTDNTAKCITPILPPADSFTDEDIQKSYKTLTEALQREVATNIGEKMPKCKYKKNASDKKSSTKPVCFVATVSSKGTVSVFICTTKPTSKYEPVKGIDDGGKEKLAKDFELAPNVSSYYQ